MNMPRCFILLGGKGTRLFPLTSFVHKSMIPVLGKPMLEHVINYLRNQDVTDIVLCLSNGGNRQQFYNYFGKGSRFGVDLKYSLGPQSLNTAGRILHAHSQGWIKDTFLVYYGDILTSMKLRNVCKYHHEKRGVATVVFSSKLQTSSGIATLNGSGKILRILEKPQIACNTNMGVYVLEPRTINYIRPDYDFFADVFPSMVSKRCKMYGYLSDSDWIDIGSFENLRKAEGFVKRSYARRPAH